MSSKLSLPSSPPDGAASRPWSFRRADLDQFAHVNNAAVWTVVEELVHRESLDRQGLTAELEHLAPVSAGDALQLVRAGDSVWLRPDDRVLVSARVGSE